MDDKKDAPSQSDQSQDQVQDVKKPDPSDNLTPEHPRFKQVIAENHELKENLQALQNDMDELKQTIQNRQQNTGNEELTTEEQEAMAKIERQMQAKGYVKKEDLEADKRVERRAQQITKLEDQHDGTDGYPRFVKEDVVEFAKRRGIDDLSIAYRELHFDAIVQVEAKKGTGGNPPGSEPPTGGEKGKPGGSEFTPEDIAAMSPEDYEKNRAKILSGLKPSGTMTV